MGRVNTSQELKVTAACWLQKPWVWCALCIFAALPVIVVSTIPLTDLGGHLGRYAVQLDAGHSAVLAQWYSFRWRLIGNLGVDLLMQELSPLMGLEPALKAVVTAIPVLQVGGFLFLSRVVHDRVTPMTLFALPLVYGYPFHFGFINFALSGALATWAIAGWIMLGDRDLPRLRWFLFVVVSCLVWLCHVVGWGLLCIFAAADCWVRARRRNETPLRTCLHVAPALACLLAPWLVNFLLGQGSDGHGETKEFFQLDKLAYPFMVLRDRWAVWDLAGALALLCLLGWGWRSRHFDRHAGLALGSLLLLIVYVLIPGQTLGSSFADMRLLPFLFAMSLIALHPTDQGPLRHMNWLALAGLAFAGARFAATAASFMLYDQQFAADLVMLNHVPRGAMLASLSVESCDNNLSSWRLERRSHLGGYAIARRHVFSNDQWVIPGGQLLTVHNPAAGEFATDMSEIARAPHCIGERAIHRWARRVPRSFGYLWILDDGTTYAVPGWRPIARSPGSVLYSSQGAGPPVSSR